jgi:hypothetical protein
MAWMAKPVCAALLLGVLPLAYAQLLLPGQQSPGQAQAGQVLAPGSFVSPPVGAGTMGPTTQIFPNAPNPTGGPSLPAGTASGISGTAPSFLNNSALGSGSLSTPATPTSVTSADIPGYATPGTVPLPGFTSPPGSLSFPQVSSVPAPGAQLTPGTPLSGSSGSLGVGAAGTGSGILTRPGP